MVQRSQTEEPTACERPEPTAGASRWVPLSAPCRASCATQPCEGTKTRPGTQQTAWRTHDTKLLRDECRRARRAARGTRITATACEGQPACNGGQPRSTAPISGTAQPCSPAAPCRSPAALCAAAADQKSRGEARPAALCKQPGRAAPPADSAGPSGKMERPELRVSAPTLLSAAPELPRSNDS